MPILCNGFAKLAVLERLDLSGNSLDTSGYISLSKSFVHIPQLQYLDLDENNSLTVESYQIFCNALHCLKQLREVYAPDLKSWQYLHQLACCAYPSLHSPDMCDMLCNGSPSPNVFLTDNSQTISTVHFTSSPRFDWNKALAIVDENKSDIASLNMFGWEYHADAYAMKLLQQLPSMPSLAVLRISTCTFSETVGSTISQLVLLRELCLHSLTIHDASLLLSSLSTLTSLFALSCNIFTSPMGNL